MLTKKNRALKPCPFCGTDKVTLDTDGRMTWVFCYKCDTRGQRFFNDSHAADKAVEAWNTRAKDGGQDGYLCSGSEPADATGSETDI